MPKIILASSSVQRKKLLVEAGLSFKVIVSHADETPVKVFSLEDQLKDISMRKALTVMNMVESDEDCIIVAADQNIVFNGIQYGKPHSIMEARNLIKSMQNGGPIYTYVGNTVLYVSDSKIVNYICESDMAVMKMGAISNEELEIYLKTQSPLSKCGGINIADTPSLHLVKGKMSTARGMTIEYLIDMLSQF